MSTWEILKAGRATSESRIPMVSQSRTNCNMTLSKGLQSPLCSGNPKEQQLWQGSRRDLRGQLRLHRTERTASRVYAPLFSKKKKILNGMAIGITQAHSKAFLEMSTTLSYHITCFSTLYRTEAQKLGPEGSERFHHASTCWRDGS